MNKFFLVDARKFVMLSTYYAFKTEGVLCLDDADVKEFLKKYNMIYNTKTKQKQNFIIGGAEIYKEFAKFYLPTSTFDGEKMKSGPSAIYQISSVLNELEDVEKDVLKTIIKSKLSTYSNYQLKLLYQAQEQIYAENYGKEIVKINSFSR